MNSIRWGRIPVAIVIIVAVVAGMPRLIPADSDLRLVLVPVVAAVVAGALFFVGLAPSRK